MSISSVSNIFNSSLIISNQSSPPPSFLYTNQLQQNSHLSETIITEGNHLNDIDSIDHIFNSFRSNKNTSSLSNSLSSSFNQASNKMDLDQHTVNSHLIKSLTNLNMLNQSFSSSLLFKSDSQEASNNNSAQQCGICGKYPMINGKTLVGCLHSFCQMCLMSNNSLVSASSIIACPICSQETLIPNGGIDALMPHYSNPLLLSLNHDLNNRRNSISNGNNFINLAQTTLGYTSSSTCSTTASSPVGNNSNGNMSSQKQAYSIQKNQHPSEKTHINSISACINEDSSEDQIYSQSKKPTFQQQHNRLLQIENEIQKTYKFYVQSLNERRDYLLKEFHAIVQFVISQNQKNKTQQFKQRQVIQNFKKSENLESENDLKNSEFMLENESPDLGRSLKNNDLQAMINNYLMSVEFVTNLPAIQNSIYNTFGYIRYNSSSSLQNGSNNTEASSNYNNLYNNYQQSHNSDLFYTPKPIGSSSSPLSYGISGEGNNFNNSNNVNNNQSSYHQTFNGQGNSHNINNNNGRFIMNIFSSTSNNHNNPFQFNDHLDSSDSPSGQHKQSHQNNTFNNSSNLTGTASSTTTSWSSVVAASTNRTNLSNSSNESNLPLLTETINNQETNHRYISNASTLTSSQSAVLSSSSSSSSSASSSTCNENQADSNNIEDNNSNQLVQQHQQSNTNNRQVNNSTPSPLVLVNLGQQQYQQQQQQTTANPLLPARSQLKRSKMIYNCKFGEFGVTDGQFTEPSGVAINSNSEIIVADTNSHRIQIFDREGRFKFKFGECGKREGQLLYPNRVAVVKHTGDIVVTERSPTHQIQVYNQYGHFLRKFGANILQHPRGVCVDSKGRIIVVECKVMRVLIFDLMGNVLQKFNCSKYLEFPNGCCCSNDREEIFISDNRAHCIKVFNYEGQYMRQIGGEGITNYPIGVGINLNGEVLVADNHNNFNLTVFTQDGQVINALESKVKHAQCFDVGLMDDGSIVLASKDYRIYVYRYNSAGDGTAANPSLIQIGSNNSDNSNQLGHSSNKTNISLINGLKDFSF